MQLATYVTVSCLGYFLWLNGNILHNEPNCRAPILTCEKYKSSLRHIHDPVLSSLKMKSIHLPFLLTAFGLSPSGSTYLHTNNTQNNTNNDQTTQKTTNVEECRPCPIFASFTLAFALQLRKKHWKTSVRVRKTSVRVRKTSVKVQYTYYQKHPHITKPTHTHAHTTKQYKTTTVQIKTQYLGSFFLEPKDIQNISLGAIWSFSKASGLPWLDMGHKGPFK
jgi:hypothetical protein